jgi:hypothetical protein
MRSPIGPILVLFGLATTVVLVLLLFQNIGTRSELESARAEIDALRLAIADQEPGLSELDLDRRLDALETEIRDWLISSGVDAGADGGIGSTPGTDPATGDATVERLDEIVDRLEALDDRIDGICGNVPVC